MAAYRFQLSELKEFDSVLREENREAFVRRFADYQRQLLCNRMVMISRGVALPLENNQTPDYLFFREDYENNWKLIKEMMVFKPDFSLLKKIIRRFRFMSYCKQSVKSVFGRGWRFFGRSLRRYFSIWRRYRKIGSLELTFQDMFSVAVARFVSNGWGNGSDFKQLLEA